MYVSRLKLRAIHIYIYIYKYVYINICFKVGEKTLWNERTKSQTAAALFHGDGVAIGSFEPSLCSWMGI